MLIQEDSLYNNLQSSFKNKSITSSVAVISQSVDRGMKSTPFYKFLFVSLEMILRQKGVVFKNYFEVPDQSSQAKSNIYQQRFFEDLEENKISLILAASKKKKKRARIKILWHKNHWTS